MTRMEGPQASGQPIIPETPASSHDIITPIPPFPSVEVILSIFQSC